MWTAYHMRWDFLTKLCGSVPADPEMVEAWLASRTPKVRPPGGKSLAEINEEVLATLGEPPDDEQRSLLVFQRWEGCCTVRAATIKAHIKDCSRVISNQYVGRIEGERAFSTRVINGVYPDERVYWVPVLRPDGSPVLSADGAMDRAVHVRGQSALKRFEWIEPARLEFTLKVLKAKGSKPSVSREDLITLFEYGGVHGYGGERGNGEGKYTFTILKQEEDDDAKQ